MTTDTHNTTVEQRELATWSAQPDRMVVYFVFPAEAGGGPYRREFVPRLAEAHVTTWPGTRVGRITRASVYTGYFGGRVVALRVLGTNGAEYYGRASWDNGNAVVLTRVRSNAS